MPTAANHGSKDSITAAYKTNMRRPTPVVANGPAIRSATIELPSTRPATSPANRCW